MGRLPKALSDALIKLRLAMGEALRRPHVISVSGAKLIGKMN